MIFRDALVAADRDDVRELVTKTGFFSAAEIEIAVELVDETLVKGKASDYIFILAEHDRPDGGSVADAREGAGAIDLMAQERRTGRLAGYACFGPIPCTTTSFDLYWIAVAPEYQGQGLGRQLMAATEERVRAAGGDRIYADTSQRPQYAATRIFYERCGFKVAGVFPDFYAPGDGKVVFCKILSTLA